MAILASHPCDTDSSELKRIGFIKSAAESSVSYLLNKAEPWKDKALDVYTTYKDATVLKPGLDAMETAIFHYGSPLVDSITLFAPQVIQEVDSKVDNTVTSAENLWARTGGSYTQALSQVLTKVNNSYPDNLAKFNKMLNKVASPSFQDTLARAAMKDFDEARERYFGLVEQSLELVRTKLPEIPHDLIDKVVAAVALARAEGEGNARALLDKVMLAWEALISNPTVRELLQQSHVKMMLLKKHAITALQVLQENKTYQSYQTKALDLATAVQEDPRYKTYVDPALAKITSSKYYSTMTEKVKVLLDALEEQKVVAVQASPAVQPAFESQLSPESTDDTLETDC